MGPGDVFGKYLILSEIGRGGMGVVYLAEDKALSRHIALKLLPLDLVAQADTQKRFMQEAKAAAALAHPSIVHIHTFDVVDGIPCMEMEYIEGGSLAEKLRREFISPSQAVRYAHQVTSALAYCHAKGAIHRDVKPSNILIDAFGAARLSDFGLAKIILELENSSFMASQSGVFRGTPLYAPPEAWESQDPTEAWDLYSVGAVLYESLTGVPPYQATSALELARKVATSRIEPVRATNPAVSESLAEVVESLLAYRAEDRLSDAAELVERLVHVDEYEASVPASQTVRFDKRSARKAPKKRTLRPHLRKPVYAVYAVLAVAMCIAALVYLANLNTRESDRTAANTGPPAIANVATFDPGSLARDATLADIARMETFAAGDRHSVLNVEMTGGETVTQSLWCVQLGDDGEPRQIIGVGDGELLMLRESKPLSGGAYSLSGDWAAYKDRDGTVLQYGTAEARLQWQSKIPALVGTILLNSEQNHAADSRTIIATTTEEPATGTLFTLTMEASPYVQPMLHNELRPRGFAWATELAGLFPAIPGNRIRPQFASDGEISSALAAPFDGTNWARLNDATRSATLTGYPESAQATLLSAYTETGILFTVQCAGFAEGDRPRLHLCILRDYAIPLSHSPRLEVHYTVGDQSADAIVWQGGHEGKRQSCTVVSELEFETWSVAGFLPYDLWGAGAPGEGEEWRITGRIDNLATPSSSVPVCWWGHPAVQDVHHGSILAFHE